VIERTRTVTQLFTRQDGTSGEEAACASRLLSNTHTSTHTSTHTGTHKYTHTSRCTVKVSKPHHHTRGGKEKKRNEGRVNKKRRVEDVEKVKDVEKFVNLFTKRLRIDDV
jgi:hypothetical protein